MSPPSTLSAAPPLRILVIAGDGIGREVVPAALAVLRTPDLDGSATTEDVTNAVIATLSRSIT